MLLGHNLLDQKVTAFFLFLRCLRVRCKNMEFSMWSGPYKYGNVGLL